MSINPAWIDPNVHSPECIERTMKIEADRKAYAKKWPKHCRKCDGQGGKDSYYDPSPSGVSLSPNSMKDFDLCSDCTTKGICPRCGHKVYSWINQMRSLKGMECLFYPLSVVLGWVLRRPQTDEDSPCPFCGWNWGKNPDEFVPDHDECGCGQDVMYEGEE